MQEPGIFFGGVVPGAVDREGVSHVHCARYFIFDVADGARRQGRPGEPVSHVRHARYFVFDAADGTRRQGKPGETCFPRSLHLRVH